MAEVLDPLQHQQANFSDPAEWLVDPTDYQPPVTRAMPQKPATGFERFLEKGLAMAGGKVHKRGQGSVFGEGWAKGLKTGQAIEKARAMYGNLTDGQRKTWEDQANLRDVRSPREIAQYDQYRRQRADALGLKPPADAQSQQPAGEWVQIAPGRRRFFPAQGQQPAGNTSPEAPTRPVTPAPPANGSPATPSTPAAEGTADDVMRPVGTINGKPIPAPPETLRFDGQSGKMMTQADIDTRNQNSRDLEEAIEQRKAEYNDVIAMSRGEKPLPSVPSETPAAEGVKPEPIPLPEAGMRPAGQKYSEYDPRNPARKALEPSQKYVDSRKEMMAINDQITANQENDPMRHSGFSRSYRQNKPLYARHTELSKIQKDGSTKEARGWSGFSQGVAQVAKSAASALDPRPLPVPKMYGMTVDPQRPAPQRNNFKAVNPAPIAGGIRGKIQPALIAGGVRGKIQPALIAGGVRGKIQPEKPPL